MYQGFPSKGLKMLLTRSREAHDVRGSVGKCDATDGAACGVRNRQQAAWVPHTRHRWYRLGGFRSAVHTVRGARCAGTSYSKAS